MSICVGTPVFLTREWQEGRIEAFGHNWVVIRKEYGGVEFEEFDGPQERDVWVAQGITALKKYQAEENCEPEGR